MKKKHSLSKTFLTSMLMVTIVSIILIGFLWTWQQYLTFHHESEELEEMMLSSYKNLLKTEVEKSVEYIEYSKSITEKQLNASIRKRIYEAHAIATHLYEKWHTEKPADQIQAAIKESLRAIRFNQGRGYYFILDLTGTNRLQPGWPELEGKNLLKITDSNMADVARDIIRLVKQKKEGFYHYHWPKPGAPDSVVPKIAFVKYFEPYNWIIGTGEYLNDFESTIKTTVLDYLQTIKFGRDGYIFATQWDGLDLTGPAKGKNMLGATDVNGVKIVQEFISLAKSNGGFLNYVMPKFKGMKPDPKLSYVLGIKDWQWYVGAGMYIDDIKQAIDTKQAEMKREIITSLAKIASVLFVLILLAYFFALQTSHNAKVSFELFTRFFDKGARESENIDPDTMRYSEFQTLAHSANNMIKAREKARSALIKNERKYRLIVENLNDLIIKLDRDKRLLFASPNYCELFGTTRDDILNTPFLSQVLEENQTLVKKSLSRLDQAPYRSYHEEHVLTKYGRRWLAWSNRAILNTGGEPMEYVAVGRDITEKKQAEDASRENQEWLQNILDSIQAGVIVIDPDTHHILELNRAALELIGTEKEKIVGTICHNHICPNEIGMCPVTDLGLAIDQSDRELITADGTRIPIMKSVNTATINKKVFLIESFLDMRDKKHLESMLVQAQKMEAIGTLAGGIAHDFNNILSGIFGYAQLVKMNMDKQDKAGHYLDQIVKGAQRASALVQQILTFSRQTDHETIPITVFPLLKEALNLLRSTIPASIEIKKDISSKSRIMGDPTQILQVIMNLCTNAYQSMSDAGGVLMVGLHDVEISDQKSVENLNIFPGKYLKLEVRDTGCGMEEKILTRIFDPYFTTKKIGKGTGLGLSTVDGIVKRHNGHTKVMSKPGEGSLFQIYLPVFEGDKTAKNIEKNEKTPTTGSETIMLVDDEKNILDSLKGILTIQGYRVLAFDNGKSALNAFIENPDRVDLVITDMTMPRMTGDKLSQEILSIRKDIPIILCTGYHESFTKEEAIRIGIRKYLQKPVTGMALSKIVRALLDTQESRK